MKETSPFAAAIAIARASKSPMERAAAALDPARYGVFCATYASMRVIDDFVDDEFLATSPDARAAGMDQALKTVAAWRDAATAALETGAAPAPDDRFHDTHAALAATHAIAAVDAGPWRRLADAMAKDVRADPMPDWDAFLAYAEGATAAPAAVFIEILALQPGAGGRLVSRLEGPAVERIHNSAVLLYLVHIMRDLKEDAAKGEGLLTLPDALFAEIGVDGATFAATADDASVQTLQAKIARYAERFLLPALAELTALDAALAPADAKILRDLCMPYIERYERFADAV